MKKAVVTGANGFIGSSLVNDLTRMGVKTLAVVRNESSDVSRIEKNQNLEICFCDLKEMDMLPDKVRSDWSGSVFFHFAWQGVSTEEAKDFRIQIGNIEHACEAVLAAANLKCGKFVFAASIMEYEVMKFMEQEQGHDLRNIYRSAKMAASYMARELAQKNNMMYNAAVISNVYGPGEISERFINTTLRKFLKNENAAFSEANQLYDFIYIEDAVKAIKEIAENGVSNKRYYVGNMMPKPLRDYIHEMRNCLNSSSLLEFGKYKNFIGVSLDYTEFDMNALKDDLGFVPDFSFEEGIKRTARWLEGIYNEKN